MPQRSSSNQKTSSGRSSSNNNDSKPSPPRRPLPSSNSSSSSNRSIVNSTSSPNSSSNSRSKSRDPLDELFAPKENKTSSSSNLPLLSSFSRSRKPRDSVSPPISSVSSSSKSFKKVSPSASPSSSSLNNRKSQQSQPHKISLSSNSSAAASSSLKQKYGGRIGPRYDGTGSTMPMQYMTLLSQTLREQHSVLAAGATKRISSGSLSQRNRTKITDMKSSSKDLTSIPPPQTPERKNKLPSSARKRLLKNSPKNNEEKTENIIIHLDDSIDSIDSESDIEELFTSSATNQKIISNSDTRNTRITTKNVNSIPIEKTEETNDEQKELVVEEIQDEDEDEEEEEEEDDDDDDFDWEDVVPDTTKNIENSDDDSGDDDDESFKPNKLPKGFDLSVLKDTTPEPSKGITIVLAAKEEDDSKTKGKNKNQQLQEGQTKKKQITQLPREEKQSRLVTHKVHLTCLMAHLYIRNKWCSDPTIKRIYKSLLPKKIIKELHPDPKSVEKYAKSSADLILSRRLLDGLRHAMEYWKSDIFRTMTERGMKLVSWSDIYKRVS